MIAEFYNSYNHVFLLWIELNFNLLLNFYVCFLYPISLHFMVSLNLFAYKICCTHGDVFHVVLVKNCF